MVTLSRVDFRVETHFFRDFLLIYSTFFASNPSGTFSLLFSLIVHGGKGEREEVSSGRHAPLLFQWLRLSSLIVLVE
jgi:hypothetical protein